MTNDSLGTLAIVAAVLLLPQQALSQQRNSDIQNIGTPDINTGGVRPGVASPEGEAGMGREVAQRFEQGVTLLKDEPAIVDYVNRVAQNIVRNSDAAKI